MRRKIFIFMLLSALMFAVTDCSLGLKLPKVAKRFLSGKVISNAVKYANKTGVLFIKFVKDSGKKTGEVCAELCQKASKKRQKSSNILSVAEKANIYKQAANFRKKVTEDMQYVKSQNIPLDKVAKQQIGQKPDASTLYNNMVILGLPEDITIMEKKVYKLQSTDIHRTKTHHIISATSPSAAKSREKLKEFDIDINDGRNGILLPDNKGHFAKGSKHGKSSNEYDNAVYERIKDCTTKEDLLNRLDEIKNDLYNGVLPIINQHEFIS